MAEALAINNTLTTLNLYVRFTFWQLIKLYLNQLTSTGQ